MIRIVFIGSILLISTQLVSCSGTSVEEDVAAYCDCVDDVETVKDAEECVKMLEEMSEKYEYDPGAADYIKNNIVDCQLSEQ